MDTIGFILALLVSGLIVGALARLLVPGPDPMGIAGTILVGIGGALIGGWVGRALFGRGYAPGLIMAVLGGVVLVLIVRTLRTHVPR